MNSRWASSCSEVWSLAVTQHPASRSEVELSVLHSADEGLPLVEGEDESRAGGVLRVTNGDHAGQVVRYLNAVAGGPGSRALAPLCARQVHAAPRSLCRQIGRSDPPLRLHV